MTDAMNGVTKKIAIGTAIVVLSSLVLWLAAHALRAENFMAAAPVAADARQRQLDRIESKVDWLIEREIEGKKH